MNRLRPLAVIAQDGAMTVVKEGQDSRNVQGFASRMAYSTKAIALLNEQFRHLPAPRQARTTNRAFAAV